MGKSLQEYVDWLDGRKLLWPKAPPRVDTKAKPYLKPLPDVHAVAWSVYGTLIRIADGELLFEHPQPLRMQVALDKTVLEFNMWNSMFRTPEKPWEYMLRQLQKIISDKRMTSRVIKGDVPELDSAGLWRAIVAQLEQKKYEYDDAFYGDPDELALKVSWFFHANLQGIEAAPGALNALTAIAESSTVRQSLLADAQSITVHQLLRTLSAQGNVPPIGRLFDASVQTLSYQEGVRKPSPTLYRTALKRFGEIGIEPGQILCVGCRLKDDLAVAKKLGMRTALYAGDKLSLRASQEEARDPETKPDRLLTELVQIRDILGI